MKVLNFRIEYKDGYNHDYMYSRKELLEFLKSNTRPIDGIYRAYKSGGADNVTAQFIR